MAVDTRRASASCRDHQSRAGRTTGEARIGKTTRRRRRSRYRRTNQPDFGKDPKLLFDVTPCEIFQRDGLDAFPMAKPSLFKKSFCTIERSSELATRCCS